jgi:NAD-dependent dihydropyrimidine dehydrogenase PreA subunit
MPPIIDRQKCNGCGICDRNCPVDVIQLDHEKKAVCTYPEECWHCGVCRMDCPVNAVRIVFTPPYL